MNWYQLSKFAQSGWGAWISPSGGLVDVDNFYGHRVTALKIMKMLQGTDHETGNLEDHETEWLMEFGYVRVVYQPFSIEARKPLTSQQKVKVLKLLNSSESNTYSFSSSTNRIEGSVADKISARDIIRRM